MKWLGDFFFFKFYWSIVDLECYVRLRYTAKWLSCVCVYTHTHVYIFFSTRGYYRYWIYFPVLYRFLLVIYFVYSSMCVLGLPRWLSGKESAWNARDTGGTGLIPGSGRSLGGGHGNPLQYSCLENPMDRGAWRATVHGVTKSWTQPNTTWLSSQMCFNPKILI